MWQTMCFVGTLEANMATKIIIKFAIVIRKMPPQHLKKRKVYQYQKKKEQKYLRKKNMNSDLAYLGSGKTKTELKFLQEITKSF